MYAGVGGICLEFKNLGFTISWANEFDKNACITYHENFKHKLIEGDIMEIDISSLKKVDVLAGGFPCQPFSVAGYRKGFGDNRGNHFFRMLDFVDEMRPKVLFFENVKNLVGHDNGNTFKVIQKEIEKRNYSFHSKELNTKDYGNIPHNRERIFIIGFDKNVYPENYKYFKFPAKKTLTKNVKSVFLKNKVDEKFYYREDKYMFEMLQNDITRKDTVYQFRRQYVRENKSDVCPALTANMGTGGHNCTFNKNKVWNQETNPKRMF